jgi:hypothetical protein
MTGSWSAFCLHDGSHETTSHPWMEWNVELLRPMVADMEPSEAAFSSIFEQVMQRFREAADARLTALHERVSRMLKASFSQVKRHVIANKRAELNEIEGFAQTLPRRKRHLEYALEEIKAEFDSRLEQVPLAEAQVTASTNLY